MTQISIGATVLIFFAIALGVFFLTVSQDENNHVACTLEAKICPDGSAVGRVAPSCEFAACPNDDGLFRTSGTVTGRITIGPLCPVEPCQNPLPDVYSSRTIILEPVGGGRPIDSPLFIKLAADGTFKDEIPEGDYRITLSECEFLGCRASFPVTISVTANKTLELTLDVDTGIR